VTGKGGKPAYRASTPVNYGEDDKETRWTNIGVGFKNEKGITVLLDALPVNGKIFLGEYQDYKKQQEKL